MDSLTGKMENEMGFSGIRFSNNDLVLFSVHADDLDATVDMVNYWDGIDAKNGIDDYQGYTVYYAWFTEVSGIWEKNQKAI